VCATGGRDHGLLGRTREDARIVRPKASASQLWGTDGSVRASQSVWIAPLEHAWHIRMSAQTVSDNPGPSRSACWRCRKVLTISRR
jgi:hypothetical protein